MEQTPIDNLAAERSVGFVNDELKVREATQLSCAYSAQVKSTTRDLTEKLPTGTFRGY